MALNFTLLTVLYMMATCTMGAHLAPPKAAHHNTTRDKPNNTSPSYYVILDPQIKNPARAVRPINSNSISPWKYTTSHDKNRIPEDLSEAQCLLKGCLNRTGEETMEVESRLIYRQIPVLYRVSDVKNNIYFRMELKTIAVGCTCIQPYVQQV
ncbi:interleukin 17a/f1 [Trichomycterus rosablanca]|uniref:interleukin 17a/f1 n=1 Tax=Trichomycterus rosablanca TaxID=2290929 RepID=UPI002F35092D